MFQDMFQIRNIRILYDSFARSIAGEGVISYVGDF